MSRRTVPSPDVRVALTWMLLVVTAVLLTYGLVLIGQALFDAPGPDQKYMACIESGGTYEQHDPDAYTCEPAR